MATDAHLWAPSSPKPSDAPVGCQGSILFEPAGVGGRPLMSHSAVRAGSYEADWHRLVPGGRIDRSDDRQPGGVPGIAWVRSARRERQTRGRWR
jgi:hypothetical protein